MITYAFVRNYKIEQRFRRSSKINLQSRHKILYQAELQLSTYFLIKNSYLVVNYSALTIFFKCANILQLNIQVLSLTKIHLKNAEK